MSVRLVVENVRLSHAYLFSPSKPMEGDEDKGEKYRAKFILPESHPQYDAVWDAMFDAIEEKFPGEGQAILDEIDGNNNRCCFMDGNKRKKKGSRTEIQEGYADNWYISASSRAQPAIRNAFNQPAVEGAKHSPYSGCQVVAMLEFAAYEFNNQVGVACYIRGVMFLADGEAFGPGGAAGDEEFAQYAKAAPGGRSTRGARGGDAAGGEAEQPASGRGGRGSRGSR